jgi:steroid Delta-isomerase
MPSPDELRSSINRYVEAVNARDATAIGALFTEDAVQADPASNPPNLGRDAIVAFFENSIGASESWTFTATKIHTCADTIAIDFTISMMVGGTNMAINGIEVFTMGNAGLFTSVHAYWDDSDLTFA